MAVIISKIVQAVCGAIMVWWCVYHGIKIVRRQMTDIIDLLAILFMVLGALAAASLIAAAIIR